MPMELAIELHGGRCCGIKCINGLGSMGPLDMLPAKKTSNPNTHNERFGSYRMDGNFYVPPRPAETRAERFQEYLRYLREVRPGSLVEVTTNKDQLSWHAFLQEHGFKEVVKFHNSNSKGDVIVWHLVLLEGQQPVKKSAPAPWASPAPLTASE